MSGAHLSSRALFKWCLTWPHLLVPLQLIPYFSLVMAIIAAIGDLTVQSIAAACVLGDPFGLN